MPRPLFQLIVNGFKYLSRKDETGTHKGVHIKFTEKFPPGVAEFIIIIHDRFKISSSEISRDISRR